MAEINGMLDTTEGQIGNAMKLVQEHATVIKDLTHRVRVQQKKNVDIGNKSRILNLVFYEIDDNDRSEMWEEFKALVKGIFTTNLRIKLKSIQWAHRFGHFIERNKNKLV